MTTQNFFIRKPSNCVWRWQREYSRKILHIVLFACLYNLNIFIFPTVSEMGLFLELPPKNCSGILPSSLPYQTQFLLFLFLSLVFCPLSPFLPYPLFFSSHFFTSYHLIPTSHLLSIFVLWMIIIFTCWNFISHFRQSKSTQLFTLQDHCFKSICRLKSKWTFIQTLFWSSEENANVMCAHIT